MAGKTMTLVIVALLVGCLQIAAGQEPCSRTDTSVDAVERCVNFVRQNPEVYAGEMCGSASPVNPLKRDPRLQNAAQGHSTYMAQPGAPFAHGDFGGRVRGAGFNGGAISENIAAGQRSAFGVVKGWMCSPGHRTNLMSCKYDSVGTGVDCSSGQCFYTQNYGCDGYNCCSGGGGGGGGFSPPSFRNPTPTSIPTPTQSKPTFGNQFRFGDGSILRLIRGGSEPTSVPTSGPTSVAGETTQPRRTTFFGNLLQNGRSFLFG